jgi:glutamyl-tRNA synthetase
VQMYYVPVVPSEALIAAHVTPATRPALEALHEAFKTVAWDAPSIAAAVKSALAAHALKMPQLAPAIRVLVCGRAQTPSIDAVLALFDRAVVVERLAKA